MICPLVLTLLFLFLFSSYPLTGAVFDGENWTNLPHARYQDGCVPNSRLCSGCDRIVCRLVQHHVCLFHSSGFHIAGQTYSPCLTRYHAGCIRVGEPFRSRLVRGMQGLGYPKAMVMFPFIYELCTVRENLGRELLPIVKDVIFSDWKECACVTLHMLGQRAASQELRVNLHDCSILELSMGCQCYLMRVLALHHVLPPSHLHGLYWIIPSKLLQGLMRAYLQYGPWPPVGGFCVLCLDFCPSESGICVP